MQGWSNAQLTSKGIEDAKLAGQRLKNIKFDNVYSSDLGRAIDTASIIIKNNKNELIKERFLI